MLTQLRGGAAPTDAVGLMLECHERIRGFLARAPFRRASRAGETVIFPAVRRLLDASADAAIMREIRARRGG